MQLEYFLRIASDLEEAGLLWQPEIGDEVAERAKKSEVSILVNPKGRSPGDLRSIYLWLPTVEQIIFQLEVRQAMLFHAGLEVSDEGLLYKTVIQAPQSEPIESQADSLRSAMALSLRDLLLTEHDAIH